MARADASYSGGRYIDRPTPDDIVYISIQWPVGWQSHVALRIKIGVWSWHDPKNLLTYMPYTFHIHGKFYEMKSDLVEPEVAYEQIMPILIEGGNNGYIMSEYEGQRLTHGVDMVYDEVEQVRRHQAMLASYLEQ